MSLLGPLLFIYYINDLIELTSSDSIILVADDVVIYDGTQNLMFEGGGKLEHLLAPFDQIGCGELFSARGIPGRKKHRFCTGGSSYFSNFCRSTC